MKKIPIHYVTSSAFKREENQVFQAECRLRDGRPVRDVFEFHIREVSITEVLEVDLGVLVKSEVAAAYQEVKVPCIVEHAGLVFSEYASKSYPGGLTKPMWNTLGERFIEETHSENRSAVARAVVGYCDGKTIRTFAGETSGKIAQAPRGDRKFYWDTVFVPDTEDLAVRGKTYSEIVADGRFGLAYKIRELSQSAKAMRSFLEFRLNAAPELWGA